MKILITGGLGHIGSYLLENINKISKLKKIYVIDNLSTQRFCTLLNLPKTNKKIIFIQKDLSLKNALNNFPKVDAVINLASITDAEGSLKIRKIASIDSILITVILSIYFGKNCINGFKNKLKNNTITKDIISDGIISLKL